MRFLHTMLRVRNLDTALKFYRDAMGLKEVRRIDNDKAKFTLVFLCAPEDEGLLKSLPQTRGAPLVELTYNWDEEKYGEDRYFGHLAYEVDDIYATCDKLMKMGITINRPPRDGNMAFVRSPDLHSIELLQKGGAVGIDAEHRPLVDPARLFRTTSARGSSAPGAKKCGFPRRNTAYAPAFSSRSKAEERTMGKGILLWLLGVPIPVILLLWLFFGH